MNRFRMFFVQTSTRPPTHAPKAYQTWKQNNQLPTKSHDELKDNSNKQGESTTSYKWTGWEGQVSIFTPFVDRHLRL